MSPNELSSISRYFFDPAPPRSVKRKIKDSAPGNAESAKTVAGKTADVPPAKGEI
jgi:hypothetical protein